MPLGESEWSPFISYIDTRYPGAAPYIHALFILIPILGWICWMLTRLLPAPDTVLNTITDDSLKGAIPDSWYAHIDKPVVWCNQVIAVANWVIKQSFYRHFYNLINFFAADFSKGKRLGDSSVGISIPPPYMPESTTNPVKRE